jgi:hypothetical protein
MERSRGFENPGLKRLGSTVTKTSGPSTTLGSGSTAGRDRRDERESSAPQLDPGANGPRFSAAPTALRSCLELSPSPSGLG